MIPTHASGARRPAPSLQQPIRLVIADDHAIVSSAVASMLRLEPDFAVVAICTSGDAAITAVRAHETNVLLLDLCARLDGLAVMKALIKEGICPRVVLLTAEIDDDQTLEAVRLGVGGIILKEMAPSLLVECIRTVHAGGSSANQSVGLSTPCFAGRRGCASCARSSPTGSSTSCA